MKAYSSREIIKILKDDGWYLHEVHGDHHQFKHPNKKGKVTVIHPEKNLTVRLIRIILKQAGLKEDDISG